MGYLDLPNISVLELARFYPYDCCRRNTMGQYCDSAKLEQNWFYWLLSSSVPDLEIFRKNGLLWTKVVGNDNNEHVLPDPRHPTRAHCIALAQPMYFNSYKGEPQSSGTVFTANGPKKHPLPEKEICLLSDSWLHKLEDPFTQRDKVIPNLEDKGYIKEMQTEVTWHAVLGDINNICQGIAMRFKQPSEEDRIELANEALLQVTNKLASYKLVYTPGRAPVFNLLTTTIHRCMFSIMNRRKTQRVGLQRFVSDVQSGYAIPILRQELLKEKEIVDEIVDEENEEIVDEENQNIVRPLEDVIWKTSSLLATH